MKARTVPQTLQAVLISTIVVGTLFAALVLSVNDGLLKPIAPLETLIAVITRAPIGTVVRPPDFSTPTPQPIESLTPTVTPTPTPVCPAPPADWTPIVYDQLDSPLPVIAARYNITLERLIEVNCLDKVTLQPWQSLYVPASSIIVPTPLPTFVTANCYPPFGWQLYVVRWGDTLYGLAVRFNTNVDWLMRYNCLRSINLYAGQRLYVPPYVPIATVTPLPSTNTPTPAPITDTPLPPTDTPTTIPPTTPAPVTDTPLPPTDTPTPIPPTTPAPITDTPLPPTDTPTSIPPTTPAPITDTPVPPPSATLVPPPTETPIPPPTVMPTSPATQSTPLPPATSEGT